MPPFVYQPFVAPDIPSIAALIARQGEPYATAASNIAAGNARAAEVIANARARAAEVSGDVWGRAIANIGALPGQVMAEQRANADAAQLRSLRQSEIDQNALRVQQQRLVMAGTQRLSQLMASNIDPNTGEVDHEAVAKAAAQDPLVGPDRAAQYLDTQVKSKEAFARFNELNSKRANELDIAAGRAAYTSPDQATYLAQLDHAVVAKAITPQEGQQKKAEALSQPWETLQPQLVKRGDTASQHPVNKDQNIVGGITNTVLASGPKSLTNEAELAADAATLGTPQETPTAKTSKAGLALLEQAKTANKSLELKPGRVDGQFGAFFATPQGRIVDPAGNDVTAKWQPPIDPAERLAATQAAQVAQQSRAQHFQNVEKARSALQSDYLKPLQTAQTSADTLREVVKAAQGGNKYAASMQNLEGAMTAVRAAGLNRLNQTELGASADAGNLWDRIAGWVGKKAEGQPVPADIQNDMLRFADILEEAAYGRYQKGLGSVNKLYDVELPDVVEAPPLVAAKKKLGIH